VGRFIIVYVAKGEGGEVWQRLLFRT